MREENVREGEKVKKDQVRKGVNERRERMRDWGRRRKSLIIVLADNYKEADMFRRRQKKTNERSSRNLGELMK